MLDFFLQEKQVSYYQALSDVLGYFDENWELTFVNIAFSTARGFLAARTNVGNFRRFNPDLLGIKEIMAILS